MEHAEQDFLARSYSYLQKVVGVIALALPFGVAVGDLVLDGQAVRGSISAYYYGRTGGYFVGSLCALAVFFLSYDYRPRPGHKIDNALSNVMSAAMIAVALLPTPSQGSAAVGGPRLVGYAHKASAAVVFGLLAVFSLYHFTKSAGEVSVDMGWKRRLMRIFRNDPDHSTAKGKKLVRNKIYRFCGWTIVGCMLAIALSDLFHWNLVFWLESVAVLAFGFSWLVKGGAVLADDE